MVESRPPKVQAHAAAGASTGEPTARARLDPVAIAVVMGLGAVALVTCFVSGGDVMATLSIMIGAGVLALIWVVPLRWTITVALVLGVTLEAPYEAFAAYQWRTPWYLLGTLLLGNLNLVTHVAVMRVDGFAVLMIYLFIVVWVRRARGNDIDTRGSLPLAPPLLTAVSITLATVSILWVWGIAHGGQVAESLVQVQKYVYSVFLLFLMHAAYRDSRDLRTLGNVLIGAALYRALMATFIHFTVTYQGEKLPCATTHEDSRLFAAAIVLLLVMLNERVRGATHWTRFVAAGIILTGMVFNGRRLVWVAMLGCLLIAVLISPRTRLKRALSRAMLAVAPVVVLYLAAGWNHGDSALFKPVGMVRSVVDTKRDSSSMWRDLENMNMVRNISDHPFTGIGYGHEYTEYIKLPDVSAAFPRFRYTPHNSFMVMFPFCGPVGVAGVLAMLLATVFLAARTYRSSTDPVIRTAAMMSIILVYLHLNQIYGDIGVAMWMTTFTLGPAMMIAGKLAVETGRGRWSRDTRCAGLCGEFADGDHSRQRLDRVRPGCVTLQAMAKLLLLSAIIMSIAIPVRMSHDPDPRRGFKRTLFLYLVFCLCYVMALKFFFFRLVS